MCMYMFWGSLCVFDFLFFFSNFFIYDSRQLGRLEFLKPRPEVPRKPAPSPSPWRSARRTGYRVRHRLAPTVPRQVLLRILTKNRKKIWFRLIFKDRPIGRAPYVYNGLVIFGRWLGGRSWPWVRSSSNHRAADPKVRCTNHRRIES